MIATIEPTPDYWKLDEFPEMVVDCVLNLRQCYEETGAELFVHAAALILRESRFIPKNFTLVSLGQT